MSRAKDFELQLRTRLEEFSHGRPLSHVHPFVTISRQAGAGGHTLAERLVEVFAAQSDQDVFGEWQIFDRALCDLVVQDPSLSHTLDSLVAEDYRSKADEFVHQILRPSIDQDFVMERVFQAVRAVASIGKAIIIGRAGSVVTEAMGPGVRLRVVAPEKLRIERLIELHGVDRKTARDRANKLDASRARLLSAHFDVDIEDPLGYDAVVNTASLRIDEIAELVTVLLRRRAAAIPMQ